MSKVAVVRTPVDYSDVEAAVRTAVELCDGGAVLSGAAGRQILVKPNLVETNDGESGNTTDKRIVGALVKMAIERGAVVTVGDSGGTRWHGATDLALKETGMREYCERLGAEVASFDKTEPVKVEIPNGTVLKEAYLASPAIECVAHDQRAEDEDTHPHQDDRSR